LAALCLISALTSCLESFLTHGLCYEAVRIMTFGVVVPKSNLTRLIQNLLFSIIIKHNSPSIIIFRTGYASFLIHIADKEHLCSYT